MLRRLALLAFADVLRALPATVLRNTGVAPAEAEAKVARAVERWRPLDARGAAAWCGAGLLPGAPGAAAFADAHACPLRGLDGVTDDVQIVYDELGAKAALVGASVDTVQLIFGSDSVLINRARDHT